MDDEDLEELKDSQKLVDLNEEMDLSAQTKTKDQDELRCLSLGCYACS